MQDTMTADKGIVYAGYADAVAWVSALPDDALEDFILRMGEKPRHGIGLQRHALGLAFDEFKERTYSSRIVRVPEETLFDRDPRAIRVMERVLEEMEQNTGGYAFEQNHDDCVNAIWTGGALVRGCAGAASAEDLHRYLRAMEKTNDFYFLNDADYSIIGSLDNALSAENVEDPGSDDLRYVGHRQGFITEDVYNALVATERPFRQAMSRARDQWNIQYRHACGPFDIERARECFEKYGHARYYHDVDAAAGPARSSSDPETEARNRAFHAEHARKVAEGERFSTRERAQGFSAYGYWFAPDGTAHPMSGFQIHEHWIRGIGDGGPGISKGRYDALSLGWVSMTMMDDKSPGANIAYGQGAPCQKALKAAARIIRRGGEFSNVVIEAYDGWDPVSYEFHEDTRTGMRRLNEIASGISPALRPS
ncbi:hypothetical protein D3C71_188460 [compost metagenome]